MKKQKEKINKMEKYEEMVAERMDEIAVEIYEERGEAFHEDYLARNMSDLLAQALEDIEDLFEDEEETEALIEKQRFLSRLLEEVSVAEFFELLTEIERKQEEQREYDGYRSYYGYNPTYLDEIEREFTSHITSEIEKEVLEIVLKEIMQHKVVRRMKWSEQKVKEWIEKSVYYDYFEAIYNETNCTVFMCGPSECHNIEMKDFLNLRSARKIKKEIEEKTKEVDEHLTVFYQQVEEEKENIKNKKSKEEIKEKIKEKAINEVSLCFRRKALAFKEEKKFNAIAMDVSKDFLNEKIKNQLQGWEFHKRMKEEAYKEFGLEEDVLYEIRKSDVLGVEEITGQVLELKIIEVLTEYPLVKEEVEKNINLYKEECKNKQEKLSIWMKDVIGESVFETFKKNNPQKIIIHCGETNTGKTFASIEGLKKADSGMYLAPLRLLALEVAETLNENGVKCSLKTGEEQKTIQGAKHRSSTVEMADLENEYDCVVIDESQMIGDEERGNAWVRAILGVKTQELHIITATEGLYMIEKALSGKEYEIKTYKRENPLVVRKNDLANGAVKKGDALIVFSRKAVLQTAADMEKRGFRTALIYGAMPPSVRRKQMIDFKEGKYDVVVSTDAIGMGVNLPIKRVFFLETRKYDGKKMRPLTTSEVKQIAGRAGRKGLYEEGHVCFAQDSGEMSKKVEARAKNIEQIYIKPTYEMFENFIEKTGETNALKALSEFIVNWSMYMPKEKFVKIQKMERESEKLYSLTHTGIRDFTAQEVWRYVGIEFDERESDLKYLWLDNIKAEKGLIEKQKMTMKKYDQLEMKELQYKELDLRMKFEKEGTEEYEEYRNDKERLSEEIFSIIYERYGKLKNRCVRCKSVMKEDREEKVCTGCIKRAEKKKLKAEKKKRKLEKQV